MTEIQDLATTTTSFITTNFAQLGSGLFWILEAN